MKLGKLLGCVGALALGGNIFTSAFGSPNGKELGSSNAKESSPSGTKGTAVIPTPTLKEATTSPDKKYTAEQRKRFWTIFGWLLGAQSGAGSFQMTDEDLGHVFDGFKTYVQRKDLDVSMGEEMPKLQEFLMEMAKAYEEVRKEEIKKIAEKNMEEGKTFLAKELEGDSTIKKTTSGLHYKILAVGNENERATEADEVKVNYVGKLISGKVFDQSQTTPITFPLRDVIPGLREGLQLVGKGGKIRLYIPPSLAYNDSDIPMIPAGSTLIFEMEVLDIQKSVPPPTVIEKTAPPIPAENTRKTENK
ncbi:MAG: FKBP-type peptidyl-prolyl cis-trans isomerase [Puniceicoccales bacterium]|jgi:FKBP-type peptidyl-prolyl cis-trans isomerase|nr:FKBP-type peptidyl-prolyl cis-trans isomerase [Puniceicoccales bacterium]